MNIIQLNKPLTQVMTNDLLMKRISNNIQHKNYSNNKLYCKQIINDIIYNEKAHIVAIFKDYLIFDDTSEFLKRSYKSNETNSRLMKIFEFYDSYSKIFPNYTVLPEAKYIYKNIQRKQKMIDNLQKKNKGKYEDDSSKEDKIFLTDVYNSIMNLTVYTMKPDENNTNTHQILLHRDGITKKDLNLSIMIDDSNQSLEGLIDNIGKAEESSYKPVKYEENMKKPPENTKESQSKIQSLLKKNNIKNNQVNVNQFNKKIDLSNKSSNKKLQFSPNVKMYKAKETMNPGKTHSPHEKNLFKSIQINDKLNINSLLDSVNQHPNNSVKKKESFVTKSSIIDEKKQPGTERGSRAKNGVSHKLTLSIPKTATNNHIYNNFNIINNFLAADPINKQIELPYSQINIIRKYLKQQTKLSSLK